ncbi:hypothetical protein CRENBAI_011322 [Crenichthys baileyi]|uniref:Uncharacterized protein n=1 Tax=Crenichthys baileyi TaxID=28760 RepID=A0AAV9RK30_9TELE
MLVSGSMCCSPTELGPREFRWTTVNVKNCPPTRPRGRQFSLQFSRQASKASIRSLPSPKGLGRRRRVLGRHQSRRSPSPTTNTLQLPEADYNNEFQGTAVSEDNKTDEMNQNEELKDSQSESLEKK